MRYPVSDKAEMTDRGEPHLPVRCTLKKLGIPRTTFYCCADIEENGGPEAFRRFSTS